MKKPKLIISEVDHERLEVVVSLARMDPRVPREALAALLGELGRARVVPVGKVPADVVTMNSVVRLRDLDSDEVEEYELVYPAHADIEHDRISILAPIGTAILGYRLGDVIAWAVPDGVRRLRVDELLYQPERVGDVQGSTPTTATAAVPAGVPAANP